ncbi:MAG: enoyl-CoA hydratase-related protein [Acidobacteria bacterium]|nr:enoyl-CoA hydratase-related protein [Acidobacteriota bacterium]
MSDSTEQILCELRDPFAVVAINREARNNAFDFVTLRELARVFSELRSNTSVRAVILTGAGDQTFSEGADVEEMSALTAEQAKDFALAEQNLASMIEDLGKPVIAAINGAAYGVGCELASACTWRIAVATAKFGFPEISRGFFGGASRLRCIIGGSRALEMILTGELIDAEEALRIGLVNRLARDRKELMAVCEDLAIRISRNAPLAVKYALEAVNRGARLPLDDGWRLESALFGLCLATEDAREGTRAFLEKRQPVFKGKQPAISLTASSRLNILSASDPNESPKSQNII